MKLREILNRFGKAKTPFLFIIDFDMKDYIVTPLDKIPPEIRYDINGIANSAPASAMNRDFYFRKFPIEYDKYLAGYKKVNREFYNGNTFLLNLTFPTKIETDLSLSEIYNHSKAKYRLLYDEKFVVFSPETFIIIEDNKIFSFPMKGTIEAAIPDAERIILDDEKELAEHTTITDLIRNDLSSTAKNVRVEKFRYIEKINALGKELLQVSSKISGELDEEWNGRIGDILIRLLPAGSISGAPKPKTIEIIKDAENYNRGFFTGVFGIYDGRRLESAVMIRFIEKTAEGLVFKSGGGITVYSDPVKEYNELTEKVYVPVSRNV